MDGDAIPSGNITFNGGDPTTAPGDKLVIAGGNQGTVTYNYTSANSGSVVMSDFGTVNYTGLEPIHQDTALPPTSSSTCPPAPIRATLGDDGTSGNGLSRLSGATINHDDFANPTGTLTINRGNAADTLTVNALPDFNAGLTIGAAANPFSAVTFAGAMSLAANKNLSANASGTIRLSSNSSDLATTGTGAITLKTSLNVELVSGSSITIADGNLLIEANKDGTAAGNFYGFESFDGSLLSTGAGNITVEAQGGDDAATGTHVGVRLIGTTQIKSTGTGSITLTGTSGTGTFNNNGFTLGTEVQVESSSGAIQLTGSVGPSTSSDNSGITIGGKVIAHSSATITIMGTGGSGTSSNTGVGIGGLVTTSEITTENGDLVIIGVGGPASTATNNVGIGVGGAMISSTGLGKITLDGTGGTGTSTATASSLEVRIPRSTPPPGTS